MNKYVGKKLEGRYQIEEIIGIGGMAEVYRAYDILEKKDVAVKVLKDEYLSNEDFKRRFRNESKAISVLSHTNIVKIFDVNFGENIQFIVMEYIDGVTLKEYITQQGKIMWKESVHFTLQILKALQHAHDNGIVHRDIKPQNVMILRDGTVKVMDFGIARFARDNTRTVSEKAIGSVHYISPEQARGEITDEKSDIYSTGVMLFEMLTGVLPFDGDNPVSVAIKQMQAEPQKPTEINPEIPEGLEEIIIRAMQKDCDLRYPTAAEMIRDVEEFKRNPSVLFEYKYFIDDGTTKYFDKVKEKQYSKDEEPRKKRKSPTIQILLGITLVAMMIIGVALYVFFTGIKEQNGEDILVYALEGLSYADVIKDEAYKDLEIVKVSEEKSDDYEAGVIIEQTPKANKNVKVGSEVSVIVSSGLNKANVPDVTGMTKDEAKSTLEKEGFKITETSFVEKFSNKIDEGLVINTNPSAGTEMKKSDEVKIYVSSGVAIEIVKVPDVEGLTEEMAKQKLLSYGLKYGTIQRVNSYDPKGTVVNQSLKAGSEVNEGTTIELQVSNGVPVKIALDVKIPFGSNLYNKSFKFDIYLDGVLVRSKTLNPTKTKELAFTVEDSGKKILTVQVDNKNYARYEINFEQETITQKGSTNSSLLQAPKKEESSSSSSSKPSSSSSSKPTSSSSKPTSSSNVSSGSGSLSQENASNSTSDDEVEQSEVEKDDEDIEQNQDNDNDVVVDDDKDDNKDDDKDNDDTTSSDTVTREEN